jgi:sulfite dehydrogenase (quinone) subunit SoeC
MHPAPSLIAFTVLSGLGLGLLALLGLGLIAPTGWAAFLWFGLGYGLTLAGLAASACISAIPNARSRRSASGARAGCRARRCCRRRRFWSWRRMRRVRSSSPRRCRSSAGSGRSWRWLTVLATAMIYAQLRTVPRWHHWSVPVLFLLASVAGGLVLIGDAPLAPLALALLAAAMLAHWMIGDQRFAAEGHTAETATGLGGIGQVRLLEPPHTGKNYLLREMVHVVGRKHAARLRVLALICAVILPMLALILAPGATLAWVLAVALHVAGMLAARWLFFAEAEHVVGLYYGRH